MSIFVLLFFVVFAYLLGSISSAILVCQCLRLPDPRTLGSKNPGATNVLRIGGKGAAAATLLGDVLKGFIPVLIAKWLIGDPVTIGLTAFAAFLGHLYPIFFKFEGGKGIATLIGALIAISPLTAISFVIIWLFIAVLFRFSSLASLTAATAAPFLLFLFTKEIAYLWVFLLIALLVYYRHRENIQRLLNGTENKIGRSKL